MQNNFPKCFFNILWLICESSCIISHECTFLQEVTRPIHGRKIHWLLLHTITLLSAQGVLWSLEGLSREIIACFPCSSCSGIFYSRLSLLETGDWKRGLAVLLPNSAQQRLCFYLFPCLPVSGTFTWFSFRAISVMSYWNFTTVI